MNNNLKLYASKLAFVNLNIINLLKIANFFSIFFIVVATNTKLIKFEHFSKSKKFINNCTRSCVQYIREKKNYLRSILLCYDMNFTYQILKQYVE